MGAGTRVGRAGRIAPCACVYRAVFRACFHKFFDLSTSERYMSRVTWEAPRGRTGNGSWGRKREEFIADFHLIAKRTLNEFEWGIFLHHFLSGGDWKFCCRRLRIDRGNFFHGVYRLEKKLGAAYAETLPYPLYPVNEYFHGVRLGVASCLESPAATPVTPLPQTVREFRTNQADTAGFVG